MGYFHVKQREKKKKKGKVTPTLCNTISGRVGGGDCRKTQRLRLRLGLLCQYIEKRSLITFK